MSKPKSTSDSTEKQIVHEGPSVSTPASEIKFIDTGVKTDKGELRAGAAYGEFQNGRHGTFVRMPAGFKSPVHTHTEDYFAVVIEGVGSNHPVDGEAVPLATGSYWYQRGEEAHVTECLSETDCLFFIVQPGKFDYVIEDDDKKQNRPPKSKHAVHLYKQGVNHMSHHYSGPQLGFPCGDPRLDFCDLYAFPKPDDASKSILVMNVHPSSSVSVDRSPDAAPTELTTSVPFASDAIYELKIDTNGDNVADVTYRVVFSPFTPEGQTATLRLIKGPFTKIVDGDGEVVIEGAVVSLDAEPSVAEGAGHRLFLGWRSDPFFFDPASAFNGFDFTASKDFFADKDVCSIVLEIPNSVLGSGKVALWARTVSNASGSWVQADRGALAAQSVFLTNDQRDVYLISDPADDDSFIPVFAHSLEHLGGYGQEEAKRVATTLLPDVMHFDPAKAAIYPHNGRTLNDDIMGPFLAIITNGKVTTHGLHHHQDLLVNFPYLGAPHTPFSARPHQPAISHSKRDE